MLDAVHEDAWIMAANTLSPFSDRNDRIDECRRQAKALHEQKRQLEREETRLRHSYDQVRVRCVTSCHELAVAAVCI